MGIRISHLRKQFASFTALDDITLDVRQGELLALLGPSGSGKTTLLRIMAGLEHADGGQVLFGDEDATRMSVQSRRVGFVFQHYALFKHMDVFENIAFGLRVRRGKERWGRSAHPRTRGRAAGAGAVAGPGAALPDPVVWWAASARGAGARAGH